jgi:hypothetical protein
VATLGNSTAKLGTLGGAQNNNMRFYFNDLDARSPSVILAALRFGEGWEVKGGENSITAPISESGNVLALGQNFQLNVGRKRTLDENWTTLRDGEPNGVNDCPNGTWETNNSILTGGSAEGVGPGTLHLLGAVAALESTSPAKNSILRVDSGWKVNCYQSVRGFATIEIIDGTVELRSGQDDDAFNAAATELMANIVTVDRGGKFYRNSANSELEIPGDCRTGNLAINLENFPVAGGLVLDSNSKIIFGTALDNLERHVQKGALILHGDGTGENPQLTVDQNGSSIFGLDLAGNAEVPSDNFPINCWIVQMPKLQDSDNVGGLLKTPVAKKMGGFRQNFLTKRRSAISMAYGNC